MNKKNIGLLVLLMTSASCIVAMKPAAGTRPASPTSVAGRSASPATTPRSQLRTPGAKPTPINFDVYKGTRMTSTQPKITLTPVQKNNLIKTTSGVAGEAARAAAPQLKSAQNLALFDKNFPRPATKATSAATVDMPIAPKRTSIDSSSVNAGDLAVGTNAGVKNTNNVIKTNLATRVGNMPQGPKLQNGSSVSNTNFRELLAPTSRFERATNYASDLATRAKNSVKTTTRTVGDVLSNRGFTTLRPLNSNEIANLRKAKNMEIDFDTTGKPAASDVKVNATLGRENAIQRGVQSVREGLRPLNSNEKIVLEGKTSGVFSDVNQNKINRTNNRQQAIQNINEAISSGATYLGNAAQSTGRAIGRTAVNAYNNTFKKKSFTILNEDNQKAADTLLQNDIIEIGRPIQPSVVNITPRETIPQGLRQRSNSLSRLDQNNTNNNLGIRRTNSESNLYDNGKTKTTNNTTPVISQNRINLKIEQKKQD